MINDLKFNEFHFHSTETNTLKLTENKFKIN